MINGAHVIMYSRSAEADRAFFRDVLKWPQVDVGGGWLIFGMPPAEVAVHPEDSSASNDSHELYLMCDDIAAFASSMGARRGVLHGSRGAVGPARAHHASGRREARRVSAAACAASGLGG